MKSLNIKLIGLGLLAAVGFSSCSDDFLREKQNFDQADPAIYNDYTGCLGRLSDCYALCLPNPGGGPNWQYPSYGASDDLSKCTEEYSGFGVFVNPLEELNTVSGIKEQPDYFQGADALNIRNNVWGLIRNINDAIIGIEGGTLSREEKDELVGQLYILRAWRYFLIWKWYGGVPIITDCPPIEAESVTPRSTAKEVYEFMINDLNTAATMLEPSTGAGQWRTGNNYARFSMATALALKNRIMAWWCSPLFNRSGDEARMQACYTEMKADLEKINAAGYGLYKPEGKGNTIKDWANMFNLMGAEDVEGLMIARFNTIQEGGVPDYSRNNPWEQKIRPKNTLGGGGITPSATLMGIFPMRDGGVNAAGAHFYSKLKQSSLEYDETVPFLHRDARFYRTYGFPGIQWTHSGTAMSEGTNNNPYEGGKYELWNYVWYLDPALVGDHTSSAVYGADNLLSSVHGLYLTKRSTGDKYLYNYVGAESGGQGFRYSYQSYMEIRYAELLLNLAEVAAGAGQLEEAVGYVKQIRQRAGYQETCTEAGYEYENFGLTEAASTDYGTCLAQILYERQIELAFEGKRFDDMRRWLLFDGGANFSSISGAPATWTLTGWGGNTCDFIGYKPFNGERRENIEWQVKPTINEGVGGKDWAVGQWDNMPDPIAKHVFANGALNAKTGEIEPWAKEATWNDFKSWRSGFVVELNARSLVNNPGNADKNTYADLERLATFYNTYLQAKMKRGDGLNADKTVDGMYITFLPRYYMLGFNQNTQTKNPKLLQTIGWEDYNGGQGTFDPLAE